MNLCIASAVASALVALTALTPAGRADGIDLAIFEPTPSTTGTGFQLQSPDAGADGSWSLGAIASYASNPLLIVYRVGGPKDALVKNSGALQLGGAYAFLDRFEVGGHLTFYSQSGDAVNSTSGQFMSPPVKGAAIGNLSLHAKLRLARVDGSAGTLLAGASFIGMIPTATLGQFTGSDTPEARLLMLGSFTPAALASRLTLSINAGAVGRVKSAYANIVQQSGFAWGAGAAVHVIDPLWVTAEVFGEVTPSGELDRTTGASALTPVEWLAGVTFKADRRLSIGLAGGRGVTNAPGTPDVRGVLSFVFVSDAAESLPSHSPYVAKLDDDGDADGDGIPNRLDQCPAEPEDNDGFQDADGCPDPDNDGDGVPDVQDKCPDQPETINGIEDDDGCPEIVESIRIDPAKSTREVADEAFTRGRKLMAAKNYLAACAAFEQSLQLDTAAGTRYNLAGCDAEIGKLATAWAIYRDLAQNDKNTSRRGKATELAAQVARRVPRLRFRVLDAPAVMTITLDGVDVSTQVGAQTPIDLGVYTIVVSAPKHLTWRRVVRVTREAELNTVEIKLGPEVAP